MLINLTAYHTLNRYFILSDDVEKFYHILIGKEMVILSMFMKLIEHIANIETLTDAWKRIYAGKSDDVRERSQGIDEESLADFKKNEKENIQILSKQLLDGSYTLLPLFGFAEPKKNGKFRLITAPCVRDRVVHAAILSTIQEYFPEIRNGSSYCLPRTKKKSEKVNFIDAFRMLSKQVRNGNTYIFESDIESFFDKIIKRRLLEKVFSALPDGSINWLITKIIYYEIGNIEEFKERIKQGKIKAQEQEIGLSQGSPLSPLFSNIYLNKFDTVMIKQFKNRYIRYVDDFIVICASNEETNHALEVAGKLLKDDGLTLPPILDGADSKTRTGINLRRGDTFTFLGIKVSKEGIIPNFSDAELKNHVDRKCFATKAIKMVLQDKKIHPTNAAKERIINAKIQSKFGIYGYFHTTHTMEILNKLISIKAKQAKLVVRMIKANKKGMPIISQEEWQLFFTQK